MKKLLIVAALFCFTTVKGQTDSNDTLEFGITLSESEYNSIPDTMRAKALVTKCPNCVPLTVDFLILWKTNEYFYYKKHWLFNRKKLVKKPDIWYVWLVQANNMLLW